MLYFQSLNGTRADTRKRERSGLAGRAWFARILQTPRRRFRLNGTTPAADTRPAIPYLAALRARQHAAWSSGDYAIVGTTLQIVGEQLCEALDLRGGERVLDVAAGNGNVSLAAARRWCEVTSTDYVPALLERGKARAAAEGLSIDFQEADAEALPFAAGSFDVV